MAYDPYSSGCPSRAAALDTCLDAATKAGLLPDEVEILLARLEAHGITGQSAGFHVRSLVQALDSPYSSRRREHCGVSRLVVTDILTNPDAAQLLANMTDYQLNYLVGQPHARGIRAMLPPANPADPQGTP